ncbi:MAG: sulfatase-like hydrolase/transferase [Deltaproteobacteria bacterium]|jgi:hypothetical protein|nr:sulfatase-like hydrolase/transferase [Deltaproteobacteria bacterium]
MNRMTLIVSLVALVVTLASSPARAAEKPNIVYILVDNWGWGDISIQGSSTPTPRIDAFARQGIRFTNFNIQNQCTPTRSAIHTGRLPIRSGIHGGFATHPSRVLEESIDFRRLVSTCRSVDPKSRDRRTGTHFGLSLTVVDLRVHNRSVVSG